MRSIALAAAATLALGLGTATNANAAAPAQSPTPDDLTVADPRISTVDGFLKFSREDARDRLAEEEGVTRTENHVPLQVIPLAEAWYSGADRWTEDARNAYANNLANVELVHESVAAERQGRGPAEWLPEDPCGYATTWIRTKVDNGLTASEEEVEALWSTDCFKKPTTGGSGDSSKSPETQEGARSGSSSTGPESVPKPSKSSDRTERPSSESSKKPTRKPTRQSDDSKESSKTTPEPKESPKPTPPATGSSESSGAGERAGETSPPDPNGQVNEGFQAPPAGAWVGFAMLGAGVLALLRSRKVV